MLGSGLGPQWKTYLQLGLIFLLLVSIILSYFLNSVLTGYGKRLKHPSSFYFYLSPSEMQKLNHFIIQELTPQQGYLVWSPNCRIPDIDPWHESIRDLVHGIETPVCSDLPLLSQLEGETLTLHRQHLKLYTRKKNVDCCYREIYRRDKKVLRGYVDDVYIMGDCLSLNHSVNLTADQQFVLVECTIPKKKGTGRKKIYTNLHARVPIRKDIKVKLRKTKTPKKRKMSVLIFGIDSVSRLNLIRLLPKTVDFLRRAGWVEMKGYNKMDDNTFPNLMAVLTGMDETRVRETCMRNNKDPVDGCPFIWKNFSGEGYITGYGEDEPTIGTFNYGKRGFFKTPTDYYLRPFMLAAENSTNILYDKDSLNVCLGPTLSTEHVFRYATDFVMTFRHIPFFGLFWTNSLSHSDVNTPSALDTRTLKFLQDLTNNGILNNTFVIFSSDHGMRFGKIRETYVGWLEERLPFIFMWMPEWYRRLYPQKYSNLLNNRDKLTSPFDLHLTLQEIVYGGHHNGTDSCPTCVSMFDEVPWNRSCVSAGITEHWCSCSEFQEVCTEDHAVSLMVYFVVEEVNTLLKQGRHLVESGNVCAELAVRRILTVRSKIHHNTLMNVVRKFVGYKEYVVIFETFPGQAIFEATVSNSGQFKLIGTVSRINAYGTQSKCVNDAFLKKYCFCTKL